MGLNHPHTPAGKNKRRLTIVFGLTTLYLIVEVIGGLLTGSLALLADAEHMLTDVGGLGLARGRKRSEAESASWRQVIVGAPGASRRDAPVRTQDVPLVAIAGRYCFPHRSRPI